MAETVTVPGAKKPLPKWAVFGGLGVVGLLVFQYYRSKNSQPAAAATSTDQYPPDGTTGDPSDPYSTDPATGQTYGDEAAGSGGTYGAFGTAAGSYSADSGVIGYDANGNPIYAPGYGPGTSPYQTPGGPPFSTNSAWSDWVIQELQAQNPAIDAGALTDAIGLYLNGQGLDATQRGYVFDAIAIAGDPPVAGPAGYPPKVLSNGSKGGGTGGGGTGGGGGRGGGRGGGGGGGGVQPGGPPVVKVPAVTGDDLNKAHRTLAAAGLSYNADNARDKKGYVRRVTAQNPPAGHLVAKGTHVGLTWHYVKQ